MVVKYKIDVSDEFREWFYTPSDINSFRFPQEEWCSAYVSERGNKWDMTAQYTNSCINVYFSFEKEEDAVHFKLIWR